MRKCRAFLRKEVQGLVIGMILSVLFYLLWNSTMVRFEQPYLGLKTIAFIVFFLGTLYQIVDTVRKRLFSES